MKRSEAAKLIGAELSRDEARQKLYAQGLGNFYQEMEMDSPLADSHQDISRTADHVEQHSHLFFELICCTQGSLNYLLGTKTFQVQAGDIILIPPGVIHCPLLPDPVKVPYGRYVIWASTVLVDFFRQTDPGLPDFAHAVVLCTKDTKWEYLCRFFYAGVQEAETQAPGWQTGLAGNTVQLMAHLGRALCDTDTVRSRPKTNFQEKVLDYIQNNLAHKLSVGETARYFHISESTLTHLFHREMGISFYRCVTQRRLVEAKRLIGEGRTMEQVSLAVGFPEYSAFYRVFKSEYGISPQQYRGMVRPR